MSPSEKGLTVEEKLAHAEGALGYAFRDRALLRKALTHPSAAADTARDSFERLEFLGDSVIGAIVAEEVFSRFPTMSEGGLTRVKISLVAGPVLASAALDTGLEDAIILGASELKSGRRGRISALEDAYEAVTAALYLDGGIEVARDWVLSTLGPLISEDVASTPENPKSVLQEAVQASGVAPVYRITSHEGPPHERSFTAVVLVAGEVVGEGVGRTKREAEAVAAARALASMERPTD